MKTIILIGDERVRSQLVQEANEPMVDLLQEFPQLNFDLDRIHVQKHSKSISYARREIGLKLTQAQSLLPCGIKLLIKECYRPLWVQKRFWVQYRNRLQEKYPNWNDIQIDAECSKLVAPIEVAPHATGGAVDLTLMDFDNQWLDMGTDFNASPVETNDATYTNAKKISAQAKKNRKLLVEVMSNVGFVNYPTEWWHWSYGDKYWAVIAGKPYAIYDALEIV